MCDFDLFAFADIADILGDIQGQLDTINASIVNASKPNCWDKAGIIATIACAIISTAAFILSLIVNHRQKKQNWIKIKNIGLNIYCDDQSKTSTYCYLYIETENIFNELVADIKRAFLFIDGMVLTFNQHKSCINNSWLVLVKPTMEPNKGFVPITIEELSRNKFKTFSGFKKLKEIDIRTDIGDYSRNLKKEEIESIRKFFTNLKGENNGK